MSHYRRKLGPFATAAAGETVLIHDDCDANGRPKATGVGQPLEWVRVCYKLDQPVTLIHQWDAVEDAPDVNLQIINGPTETGELSTANSFFERTIKFQPGRNRITVVMGATAPTARHIGANYNDFPGVID